MIGFLHDLHYDPFLNEVGVLAKVKHLNKNLELFVLI